MKYKIGNVDVEAVQWNGENEFYKISEFLDTIKLGLYGIERDKKDNITIEDEGSQKVAFLEVSEYLVSSKTSLFKLSEQDFNNMATKVKEPKFKVGDKAYYLDDEFDGVSFKNVVIDHHCSYGFYRLKGYFSNIDESYLFTLEEAIEKLKEL